MLLSFLIVVFVVVVVVIIVETSPRPRSTGLDVCVLDKKNIFDVCYAFGVMAAQVGAFERAYVQVKIEPNGSIVQVILDKDYCLSRGVQNLNASQELVKLLVPDGIANFIPSINAKFKSEPSYLLEGYIPHLGGVPELKDITDNIIRSQATAKLPVNYTVLLCSHGVVLIQVDEANLLC